MKLLIFSFVSFLLMSSCIKNSQDPNTLYPDVIIESAEVQEDGTILVTGLINSPGDFNNSKIDLIGFCANSKGNPKLNENQVKADIKKNKFTAVYPEGSFNPDSSYFLAPWATNQFGYYIGESKKFDSLYYKVTPPCNIMENYLSLQGVLQYQVNLTYFNHTTEFEKHSYLADAGSFQKIKIITYNEIKPGIYETNNYVDYPRKAVALVYINYSWVQAEAGAKIYVEKMPNNKLRITMCQAQVFLFNSYYPLYVSMTIDN